MSQVLAIPPKPPRLPDQLDRGDRLPSRSPLSLSRDLCPPGNPGLWRQVQVQEHLGLEKKVKKRCLQGETPGEAGLHHATGQL